MSHEERRKIAIGRRASALAAIVLLIPWAASAAPTPRAPEGPTRTRLPYGCDTRNARYVIDEDRDSCGGVSTKVGAGWKRTAWPGTSEGVYNYITRATERGNETCQWVPNLGRAGMYEVWVGYRASSNRARKAPFYVFNDDDPEADRLYYVNQYAAPNTGGARWTRLGSMAFRQGTGGKVRIVNGGDHSEAIDSVAFFYVGPQRPSRVAVRAAAPGATVSWRAAIGARNYVVLRSGTNSPEGAVEMEVPRDPTTNALLTSFTDRSLGAGRTAYYFVKALGYAVGGTATSSVSAGVAFTAPR